MKSSKIKTIGKYVVTVMMMYVLMVCTAISAGAVTNEVKVNEPAQITYYDTPAEQNGGGIDSLVGWINNLGSSLKTIAFAIAGVCVIGLAIIFITGGAQGLQKGKGWAVAILVGVAVLSLGTGIIASLSSL